MNKQDVNKIWTVLGTFLFTFSAQRFLCTTSSSLKFCTFGGGTYDRNSIGIFGLLYGAPLLFALIFVTRYYVRRWGGGSWTERFTVAFNFKLERTVDKFGRAYQVIFLGAFLIFPMVGQIFFLGQVIEGRVCLAQDKSCSHPEVHPGLEHFYKVFGLCDSLHLKGKDYRFQSYDGVTYFPFYGSWYFLLAVIWLVIKSSPLLAEISGPPPFRWRRRR